MKTRIDRLLVERGLVVSREKAQALILAGQVLAAGQKVQKPGALVPADAELRLLGDTPRYVSRAGGKLEAALDRFAVDVRGAVCLDVGSSTGGFTDCLLQRGALRVHAVDSGTNQMEWRLRNDARVHLREKTNARYLAPADIGEPVDLIVVDVSFISVTLLLPALVPLLRPGGAMLVLVKPQFEAGRAAVGPGGIVRDESARAAAVARVRTAVESFGFARIETMPSPILGAEGNQEFLLYARRE
jgi:23S rRNA (cytidine1920-2'-O)/16S rRNA (cytidine1409-2'-O)-methyltransferase